MEVGMYGVLISTEECYQDAVEGGNKFKEVLGATKKKPFVYIDPDGLYTAFLYVLPEDRKKAYKKARKAGFKSAACAMEIAYVDSKYLKENEDGRT